MSRGSFTIPVKLLAVEMNKTLLLFKARSHCFDAPSHPDNSVKSMWNLKTRKGLGHAKRVGPTFTSFCFDQTQFLYYATNDEFEQLIFTIYLIAFSEAVDSNVFISNKHETHK